MDGSPTSVLVVALAGTPFAEGVAALLDARPGTSLVVCDVAALERPGPGELDQLGRLRLVTRRRVCGLVLRNAGGRLRLLLAVTGLDEVFVCEGTPVAEGSPEGGTAPR